MHYSRCAASAAILTATAVLSPTLSAAVVTFEDPALSTDFKVDWRPAGGFSSGGAFFNNDYVDFGGGFYSWGGFALSRMTDRLTAGYINQYSVFASSGAGGSSQFGIAYYEAFTPTIPTITLPAGESPVSITLANTTYAALSMRDGDAFAKKFGGASGNDPDYFLLTITGLSETNTPTGTVNFYLADYRDANNALDYIVSDWTVVGLTGLGAGTRKLQFGFSSSDTGAGGINTPTYVAVDNVVSVPEPSGIALLLLGSTALGLRRRRR
jgi:hypothetical protein